jgi:hypothetical protein
VIDKFFDKNFGVWHHYAAYRPGFAIRIAADRDPGPAVSRGAALINSRPV